MVFSMRSVQEAHALYTGPDFPKLIKAFKAMEMTTNVFNLETGVVTYMSRSGETLESKGIKVTFDIGEVGNYKWVSDLEAMTCAYYDKTEAIIIIEAIPSV